MNVVYLLGAGASAQAIPVLRGNDKRPGMIECMEKVFSDFKNKISPFNNLQYSEFKKTWEFTNQHSDTILNTIKLLGTPDTLARRYYLLEKNMGKIDADRLKHYMVLFFILWNSKGKYYNKHEFALQSGNNPVFSAIDRRYYSFLSTILNNNGYGLEWPSNIDILTWNYDSQIEQALNDLVNYQPENPNYKALIERMRISSFDEGLNHDKHHVLKLNGCYFDGTFVINENENYLISQSYQSVQDRKLNIQALLEYYEVAIMQNNHSNITLKFAWENTIPKLTLPSDNYTVGFNSLLEKLRNAGNLVIIGYTFPHYNREMDRFILSSFGLNPHQGKIDKEIHIQNNADGIKSNKERILALSGLYGVKIHEHTFLEEFFIPSEL